MIGTAQGRIWDVSPTEAKREAGGVARARRAAARGYITGLWLISRSLRAPLLVAFVTGFDAIALS